MSRMHLRHLGFLDGEKGGAFVVHKYCIVQYMRDDSTPLKRPRTKTAVMTLRVDPRIKAAAEIAAERDHRSVTAFIEVLILAHCESKSISIPTPTTNALRR
jgi:hypothetical protein